MNLTLRLYPSGMLWIAVGDEEIVLKYDGKSWSRISRPEELELFRRQVGLIDARASASGVVFGIDGLKRDDPA
ncbi:MAG: hypothetical protein JW984_15060 [Deltaproteobacteria bacterium]|uniref:Uncharacterized protein n=1 Tax=Candidatus Zymogenus saltonus TaxID=2844893 RepID=A0A9D8KIJ3_9DELT|nr:hypothetical protein [Candidatus Zymogenus saltonus]